MENASTKGQLFALVPARGPDRQHNIVALSSNYALYAEMSNRVVSILCGYSPNVEVYSIDESFLDLGGLEKL